MNLKEVRLDKKIERKKSKAWTLSIKIAVGFVNVQELQVLKPVTKYAIFTEFYNGIRYFFKIVVQLKNI